MLLFKASDFQEVILFLFQKMYQIVHRCPILILEILANVSFTLGMIFFPWEFFRVATECW